MADTLQSVTNFTRQTNNTVDQLGAIANGALCISSLLQNPGAILGSLKNVILNVINRQIGTISSLLNRQLQNGLYQIFEKINPYPTSIFQTVRWLESLKFRALSLTDSYDAQQNCAAVLGRIAGCLQGAVNQALTPKIVAAINRGTPLDVITKDLESTITNKGFFNGYITKQNAEQQKALLQLTRVNGWQESSIRTIQ